MKAAKNQKKLASVWECSEQRGARLSRKSGSEELNFLKPLTALKKDAKKTKGRMSLEEKRELLENTALTPGGIFDEFNYFYFGYISVDWVELVFELYGPVEFWPENLKIRIAHSFGYCSMNPGEEEKKKALKSFR